MKIYILISVLLVLLIASVFVISAAAKNGQDNLSKIDREVTKKFENKNEVLVYVELDTNQKTIAQKEIFNAVGNKFKYDLGNGLISVKVDRDELARLENDNRVKSVKLVGEKYIFLDDSVPLVNGTSSWNLVSNGVNLSGTGETVCILDTGVNYSHSDLGGCYGNNNASSGCKVIGGYDWVNGDSNPYDDHGHGTHVSGIVAANGTKKGVAPGAKIIMMKVCDSGGSCSDIYIRAGIDWCVGNSSVYNISVISMSIGGGLYTSYCDYVDDGANITLGINNAVTKNISVVISAGNGLNNVGPGNATAIASPACVQNATPISATTKLDVIDTSYADRSVSIVQLLAPGTDITSTWVTGGYAASSGTSMAAPHAAGAIAILNQYLRASGQTKTTQQIESTLNSTGKMIYDSATMFNYSRIRVYDALLSLDNQAPDVSFYNPTNSTYNNRTQLVNISASDFNLDSIWFFNGTANVSYTIPVYVIFAESSNTIIAYANDSGGRLNSTSVTFSIDIIRPTINFTALTETSGSVYIRTNIVVNVTANDTNFANLTINLYNSSSLVNSTSTTSTNLFLNFTNLTSGIYYFNATATDTTNNRNYSETRNVTIDTIPPLIVINYPQNSVYNVNVSELNYSASDAYLQACWYSLDSGVINTSIVCGTNASGLASIYGNNSWRVYANDSLGNVNFSSVNFSKVNAPIITLVGPADGYSATGTTTILFEYNVTNSSGINNCSLFLDNVLDSYNSSAITNLTNNISKSLSAGSYNWIISCIDLSGNSGNSSSRSLTINPASTTSSSSSSSGGSGGGTTSKVYNIGSIEINNGYSATLSKGDEIKFQSGGNSNILKTDDVKSDYVNISIGNNLTNLKLKVGESIKINLTSKDFYELYIKLESIIEKKANITIKSIYEKITGKDKNSEVNETDVNIGEERTSEARLNWRNLAAVIGDNKIIILVAVCLIGFVVYWWTRKKRIRKRGKIKLNIK